MIRPEDITLHQQLHAVMAIVAQRQRHYPQIVREGGMRQSEADLKIGTMQAAAETLLQVIRERAAGSYQARVEPWLVACFGQAVAVDATERNHRFLEEALELVQSCGCTRSEAHQLVDYVFERPAGDKAQEVGGVMNTLAALCLAQAIDMHDAGEAELSRVQQPDVMAKIRAKQAAKPKHSPLPGSSPCSGTIALGPEDSLWSDD